MSKRLKVIASILTGSLLIIAAINKPNYIGYVPRDLMKHFYSNGWSIEYTKLPIPIKNTTVGLKGASGVILFEDKKIVIANKKAILHEFGHYLDYVCNDISSTDEFIEIYLNERDKTNFSEYHKSTPSEYFAESFSRYLLNKNEKLESYRFIEDCLERVK